MKDLRVRFAIILALSMLPTLTVIVWLTRTDLTSLTLALVAFLFGLLAVWLVSNLLVFRPLREIGNISSLFATGDLTARIKPMQNASTGIATLTKSFNSLADDISDREAAALKSLAEKEILLREIHHRVKNNLQIIISLLNMQERKLTHPVAIDVIRESRSRINAIALVHRGLYEGDDISVIQMEVFLKRLISELKNGFGMEKRGIVLETSFDPIKLSPDMAIPVALFVVETLTNAVQHGVPNGGKVSLVLAVEKDEVAVTVCDNGKGLHQDAEDGTGTKLVKGFARQLSGQLKTSTDDGYAVTLQFDHTQSI